MTKWQFFIDFCDEFEVDADTEQGAIYEITRLLTYDYGGGSVIEDYIADNAKVFKVSEGE